MAPLIKLGIRLCVLAVGASALQTERLTDPAEAVYNKNGFMNIEDLQPPGLQQDQPPLPDLHLPDLPALPDLPPLPTAEEEERLTDPAEAVYNKHGFMNIEETLRESLKKVTVGTAEPGLQQADGVENNAISQHFHSRTLLSAPSVQMFSPSLVVLPPSIAERFGPEAYYLATFRHFDGQCWNLGGNSATSLRLRKPGGSETTLSVLRRNFSVLASTGTRGWDCRLYVDGDRLWLTRMIFLKTTKWKMEEIHVSPTGSGAMKLEFGEQRKHFYGGERNLGVLKDPQLGLILLKDVEPQPDMVQAKKAYTTVHLHNSINPLEIPELQGFLGIGHAHLMPGCQPPECKKDGPKYGWMYVQTFFLFDKMAPFLIQKVSPPFCIPAASDSSRCESIQFITSAVKEGSDLLLTYGINDCESAVLRVPLDRVLDFLQKGGKPTLASNESARLFDPEPLK